MRSLRGLALVVGLGLSCSACWHQWSDAEVPSIPKLSDLMWAQKQSTGPVFKKIGKSSFTDEEWPAFTATGKRLQLTTAKLKESFSKGPEFNQLADALATHAAALVEAAAAKDVTKANAALSGAKATCKACHAKFD